MGEGRAGSKGGVSPSIWVKAGWGFSAKNASNRSDQSGIARNTAKEGVEPNPFMRFFGPITWQRPQWVIDSSSPRAVSPSITRVGLCRGGLETGREGRALYRG